MENKEGKRIGRDPIFKELNTKEKIQFLMEALEHPQLINGICFVVYELKYAEAFGVWSFINHNFKHLIEYKDRPNKFRLLPRPFWFDTHRERIKAIKEQIKIIQDESKNKK